MQDSKRLSYRLMNEKDFEFYYTLNSNKQIMKYAFAEAFNTIDEAKIEFDKVISQQNDDNYGQQYIAINKDTSEQIGIADFEINPSCETKRICEIGYFLLQEYWGMRYAAEMGRTLVDYLFGSQKVYKIKASCHAENTASEKTMIKIGLKKQEINKNGRYKDGKWADEIQYSIKANQWKQR